MKKRITAILLASFMVFGVAGCGKKDDTASTTGAAATTAATEESLSVGAEVEQFINVDLASISAERDQAVGLYNKYFTEAGSIDSEEWLRSLEYDALTAFDSYLSKLSALEYTTPEVQSLKNTYLQSAQFQRDAIADVVNGIKNDDATLFASAEEKIAQSETYFKSYEDSLKTICTNNNIKINHKGTQNRKYSVTFGKR